MQFDRFDGYLALVDDNVSSKRLRNGANFRVDFSRHFELGHRLCGLLRGDFDSIGSDDERVRRRLELLSVRALNEEEQNFLQVATQQASSQVRCDEVLYVHVDSVVSFLQLLSSKRFQAKFEGQFSNAVRGAQELRISSNLAI